MRNISQLIEQVLADQKVLRAHSSDGTEVWVAISERPKDALDLVLDQQPISAETFRFYGSKV